MPSDRRPVHESPDLRAFWPFLSPPGTLRDEGLQDAVLYPDGAADADSFELIGSNEAAHRAQADPKNAGDFGGRQQGVETGVMGGGRVHGASPSIAAAVVLMSSVAACRASRRASAISAG